jgi:hypothetical protein
MVLDSLFEMKEEAGSSRITIWQKKKTGWIVESRPKARWPALDHPLLQARQKPLTHLKTLECGSRMPHLKR